MHKSVHIYKRNNKKTSKKQEISLVKEETEEEKNTSCFGKFSK